MTGFPTVRVAAIQATPVILDAEATVDKAVGLLGDAAAQGAKLAVLPETFVPVYQSNAWAKGATDFSGWDELWERLWENSVDVPGPLTDRIAEACREHDLVCAIGVNERESDRPGSLYNALVLIGAGGVLHKHRKLMPTQQERIFHGVGAGDDLLAGLDSLLEPLRFQLLLEPAQRRLRRQPAKGERQPAALQRQRARDRLGVDAALEHPGLVLANGNLPHRRRSLPQRTDRRHILLACPSSPSITFLSRSRRTTWGGPWSSGRCLASSG